MFHVDTLIHEVAGLFQCPAHACRLSGQGGGATGETARLQVNGESLFLKWLVEGDALDAEADGLLALAPAVRVPAVRYRGPLAGGEALILEWLDLRGPKAGDWPGIGRALRGLHQHSGTRFGHHRDNWIGANRQDNRPADDWPAFFVERRLAPQLQQARDAGLAPSAVRAVETVIARAPGWLAGLDVTPVLLHGDLWQGNVAVLADGTPVVFDPAVYYGHGEADLAMLGLFGEVPGSLYSAYGIDPADPEVRHRARLYNLYHLLNHYNLFGGAYADAVDATCRRLLETA